MNTILQSLHFEALEAHCFTLLSMDSNFSPPTSFSREFPELYTPLDCDRVLQSIKEIMKTAKWMNVLSHGLWYRDEYDGFLDDFINEQLELLEGTKTLTEDVDSRDAYYTMRFLLANIDHCIIEDYYRPLTHKEKKCLYFLCQMCDRLAHYVLETDRDNMNTGILLQ